MKKFSPDYFSRNKFSSKFNYNSTILEDTSTNVFTPIMSKNNLQSDISNMNSQNDLFNESVLPDISTINYLNYKSKNIKGGQNFID